MKGTAPCEDFLVQFKLNIDIKFAILIPKKKKS